MTMQQGPGPAIDAPQAGYSRGLDPMAGARGVEPRPAPGVRFALDRQADELARLEQAVEVLEDRLGPVLRPIPPAPAVAGTGPLPAEPAPPCVVAVELAGRTERLETMVERLHRITDWVDV